METNSMGLNSKESFGGVKEEVVECCKDGFANSSGVPWPLSNKLNDQSIHPSHDIKAHPFSKINPFLKTHFMGSGQNFGSATMKQQFLGGIPYAAHHSTHPSTAYVSGTNEQWFDSKASAPPAQLTIFFAGTVNVFDDISPEKAQAIILLAGNGCVASNMAQPRPYFHAPASNLAAADGTLVNHSKNAPPYSALSSPISVSSHPIDQPCGVATKNDNIKVCESLGFSTNLVSKVEPRMVTSLGSMAATAMIASAVPQARKASLARFLEKRKERAMSSAPYNQCTKVAISLCTGKGINTDV